MNAFPQSATDEELAARISTAIINTRDWPHDALDELIARAVNAEAASQVFFRSVVEKICDLFDPDATRAYAELFAYVVARVLPGYSASALLDRYKRIRQTRVYHGDPKRVCVLSRVTLGADVVVTGTMLQAAKLRFPHAEIFFVGPPKNGELFEADARIQIMPVSYGRSAALRDRLRASQAAGEFLAEPDTLVIDPDSRLTQLGIMPVADEDRYLFFESRAYGGTSAQSLSALAADWIEQTLGVGDVHPYLSPRIASGPAVEITVSLGVGENVEKLAGDELERQAVAKLISLGRSVMIDAGAGGEETERVERLVRMLGSPPNLQLHHGTFASFAGHIMRSRFYFGYDSAGQHVAAASAVPMVTVFAGYTSERTFERWYPTGAGPIHVIKGNESDVLARTLAALTSAAAEAGLS
jgi:hypothetical protein